MTKRAATKNLQDGMCATYTYCDHLSDGWYDSVDGFWKSHDVWCCFECSTIVKLKKGQTIEEYNITEHGRV